MMRDWGDLYYSYVAEGTHVEMYERIDYHSSERIMSSHEWFWKEILNDLPLLRCYTILHEHPPPSWIAAPFFQILIGPKKYFRK